MPESFKHIKFKIITNIYIFHNARELGKPLVSLFFSRIKHLLSRLIELVFKLFQFVCGFFFILINSFWFARVLACYNKHVCQDEGRSTEWKWCKMVVAIMSDAINTTNRRKPKKKWKRIASNSNIVIYFDYIYFQLWCYNFIFLLLIHIWGATLGLQIVNDRIMKHKPTTWVNIARASTCRWIMWSLQLNLTKIRKS